MNMVFQLPKCVMTIGMGHASGLAEVPDARFMRNMPAGFMPWPNTGPTRNNSPIRSRITLLSS